MSRERAPRAIPALLEVLHREDLEPNDLFKVVARLNRVDGRADGETRALLEPEVPLLVRASRADRYLAVHAISLLGRRKAPEARAAVEWAAKSHPTEWGRERAREVLAGQED